MNKRMIVIGAGAIGMLWATKYAPYIDVTLVSRTEEQSHAINKDGVIRTSVHGVRETFPIRSVSIEQVERFFHEPFHGFTWLILAVKQIQLPFLCEKLATKSTDVGVLALQNGMGHADLLEKHFLKEKVCYGVTTIGARRIGLNEVMETGSGDTFIGPESPEWKELLSLIHDSEWNVKIVSDIFTRQWEKLVVNAVINPITAILGITNGSLWTLMKQHRHTAIFQRIIGEAVTVARSEGVQLNPAELYERTMKVAENTSRNRSSMLTDLDHGRTTEIEYINGYIVRTGKKAAVDTALHEMLQFFVENKEKINTDLL